ncbi:MAG: D-amino acid aminotransferase [Gammaproteobacteria bacterium]|nr:D-amino acid aminotransferase [Gammaproteobacteria bacterium]
MPAPLPICYLNGEWLPLAEAKISPLDRSFLFGDGVYEVVPVFAGRPFRFDEHVDRLSRSCAALRLRDPHDRDGWRTIVRGLMERNESGDLYVYLQISRGADSERSHAPLPQIPPTVFGFAAPLSEPGAEELARGINCVTAPDIRWARCDIKSVALLGNVLQRQLSCDVGADETILLRDGQMMEATTSTAHVVLAGTIVTPPNSTAILPGTTRSVVEEVADRLKIARATRAVSEAELRRAEEVWISSSTRTVSAVTTLDGQLVGSGKPGPVWQKMRQGIDDLRRALATQPW